MQLTTLLLTGLSALTASGNAIPALAPDAHGLDFIKRQVPVKPCSHQTGGVHFIVTPGEGSAQPPFGLLTSTVNSMMRAIPGSTNVSVPYNHADTVGTRQTDAGASTLRTYIQQYHQSCPLTRIVLLGYSAGAIITLNTLCGETQPPYPRTVGPLSIQQFSPVLMAAVGYGDETRTSGAHYNRGTCTRNGAHPRTPVAQGNCEKWGQILQSYCDSDDPRCCNGGTNQQAHYDYNKRYDGAATNFVVAQFRKFGV